MLTLSDHVPPGVDRTTYDPEIREAIRRARAGLRYAVILPMVNPDGANSRYLLADQAAHKAQARWRARSAERKQQRAISAEEKRRYHEAFAVLDAFFSSDDTGDGAA